MTGQLLQCWLSRSL